LLTRRFQVPDVADVQNVEAPIGKNHGLAAHFVISNKRFQSSSRNDFRI
jgi:hypothetical protein